MATLNLQVAASNRDGDQNSSGLGGDITRSEIRIGNDSNEKVAAFGFTNVTIPQGTTIISASLIITWAGTYSTGSTIQGTIWGEAADNSAVLAAANNNIAGRSNTTASVATGSLNNVTLDTEKSFDVTTIVQEIVNRGGWASGNAMSFLIRDNGSTSSEWQDVWSYDGSSAKAAKLNIEYSSGGESPGKMTANRGVW